MINNHYKSYFLKLNNLSGLLKPISQLVLILLVFNIICSAVFAEDLELIINGKDISQPVQVNNGTIDILVNVEEGVFIRDMSVESDNKFIEAIFEEEIRDAIGKTSKEDKTIKRTLTLPEPSPAGDFDIKLDAIYENKEKEQKKLSKVVDITVPSTGLLSSMLGALAGTLPKDVSVEILNHFKKKTLSRLSQSPTREELKSANLGEANLTDEDIDRNNFDMHEIKSESKKLILGPDDIKKILAETDNPSVRAAVESVSEMDPIEVTKGFKVFEIVNRITGAKTYQSKIIISVADPEGIVELELIEYIPKDIAENAHGLIFSEEPIILEEDPIVKWNFNNIPEDQVKDYSYVVNKEISKVGGITLAGAEKPGLDAKFVRFCLRGGWIIVLIIVILVIVGIVMGVKKARKNKKKEKTKNKNKNQLSGNDSSDDSVNDSVDADDEDNDKDNNEDNEDSDEDRYEDNGEDNENSNEDSDEDNGKDNVKGKKRHKSDKKTKKR